MNADQRLDQIEPILAQALATLDQHTAQNERQTAQLKVVIGAVSQQSDNIEFLLRGQAEMKDQLIGVEQRLTNLESGQARLESGLTNLESGQAHLESGLTNLKSGLTNLESGQAHLESGLIKLENSQANLEKKVADMDSKLDQILGMLGNRNN